MEKEINRREFLKLSATSAYKAGLFIFFGSILPYAGCAENQKFKYDARFVENEDAARLKLDIEDNFKVRLMTHGEWDEEAWKTKLIEGHPDLSEKWNNEYLSVLSSYLSNVPPHFIKEKYKNRRLRIIITPYPSMSCECYPDSKGNDPDEIFMPPDSMSYDLKEEGFYSFAHELIHRITPLDLPDPIDHNKPIVEQLNSPWFEAIDTILGEDFATARFKIHDKILTIDPDIKKKRKLSVKKRRDLTEEEQKSYFLYKLTYGLGTREDIEGVERFNFPSEFIAVLGEYYMRGKNYFYSMSELVFPEETVGKLYEFIKTEVFRGKEY